jgi:bacillithiol biosynthesis deacetylase BshB1
MTTVDLLAIAAHRDDVELTCAGTLVKMQRKGYRTGIIDLTAGETGTRGDAETRAREAEEAAKVMGVTERVNAGLPDAAIQNTNEGRQTVATLVRGFKPRAVILPYPVGRHPDHRMAAELCRDACYLAGLAKYPAEGEPHRPEKVLYAQAYREDPAKPSFVVDISEEFETKMAAVHSYRCRRRAVPHRPGPLRVGAHPERPLRKSHPVCIWRALLHLGNRPHR